MIVPWWPLAVLAVLQATDAALCIKPPSLIQDCLRDVRFPRRLWWVFTPVKAASTAGLVIGIWWPPLAVVTCAALVIYFVLAVGAHLRVRDIGRNLLSATGMLVICASALVFVLVGIHGNVTATGSKRSMCSSSAPPPAALAGFAGHPTDRFPSWTSRPHG